MLIARSLEGGQLRLAGRLIGPGEPLYGSHAFALDAAADELIAAVAAAVGGGIAGSGAATAMAGAALESGAGFGSDGNGKNALQREVRHQVGVNRANGIRRRFVDGSSRRRRSYHRQQDGGKKQGLQNQA